MSLGDEPRALFAPAGVGSSLVGGFLAVPLWRAGVEYTYDYPYAHERPKDDRQEEGCAVVAAHCGIRVGINLIWVTGKTGRFPVGVKTGRVDRVGRCK